MLPQFVKLRLSPQLTSPSVVWDLHQENRAGDATLPLFKIYSKLCKPCIFTACVLKGEALGSSSSQGCVPKQVLSVPGQGSHFRLEYWERAASSAESFSLLREGNLWQEITGTPGAHMLFGAWPCQSSYQSCQKTGKS